MTIAPQHNLYIYSRFKQRVFPQNLPIHIFGTSSAGNSVYIEPLHTLIDIGLPYKRYRDLNPNFFLDVDYIILTHEHGDHLNPSTLMHVLDMYPSVKVIISNRMARAITTGKFTDKWDTAKLLNDYRSRFISANQILSLRSRAGIDFIFTPHVTKHGPITNIAIELTANCLNLHLLYASDLDTFTAGPDGFTQGLPQYQNNPFTVLFLEANYDENLLNAALLRDPDDVKALGNLRHISEQTTWQYVQHYLTDNGIFIPLHASATYGTLIQNTN